ncbi:MAG: ATP-binding cassette domain-containing protein [Oscillochloridaceae bacterium]|nr:ATP-binding cassette domain-containing protein [Chloroflexaceae bacterium]MDW8391883.1 ATP-binding cassette domain-containing protein [Oscillochloridaceae bacterium]
MWSLGGAVEVAVHNLSKSFGSLRANDRLTLRFEAGKIHGVLGENGAGKSTLMKLIAGFLRPDEGSIRFDGREAKLRSPGDALRAGVGMIHQDPLDVPAFTALENLLCATPRSAIGSRAEGRRLLIEMAGRLGFTVEPDAPVARMSIGQRQQLEIIRLLACGARVLILDEPTTGITAEQTRALFAALRRLAAAGNTVLFVSHKLDEVAALCDTVCVLRAGRLVGEQMAMPVPQAVLLGLMFDTAVAGSRSETLAPTRDISERLVAGSAAVVWRLEGVTAGEGAVVLRNLSLEVPAGRVVGLAGLDGSGQQILLRLLTGRLRPDAGRVLVGGTDLTGASSRAYRAAGIEYLPADRLAEGMIGPLSLSEHFALQQTGRLVDRQRAERQAREAIAAYGIKATPETPISALSGGNQQRALLALLPPRCRGLACEQPTRGLDVASARTIWNSLLARRADGCAIVFASADLDELIEYSDEVLVFFAGRVSAPLPRAELSISRLGELIGGVGFPVPEQGDDLR